MITEKARNNFLGKDGNRYNCAQSIIKACSDLFGFPSSALKVHAEFGAGKAPDGYCGALYAALYVLYAKKRDKDKIEECKDFFLQHSGALTCKEIKSNKKVACINCVEKAAEFLSRELL